MEMNNHSYVDFFGFPLKHSKESIDKVIRQWNNGKDMPLPTNGKEEICYSTQIIYADLYLQFLDKEKTF